MLKPSSAKTLKLFSAPILARKGCPVWKDIVKKFSNLESVVSLILGVIVIFVTGATVVNLVKNEMRKKTSSEQSVTTTTQVPGAPVGEKIEAIFNSSDFPKKYVVKDGDTLWSISLANYNSGYNWVDVMAANNLTNPDLLTTGMEITLPQAEPISPEGNINEDAVSTAKVETYIVKLGDNLWQIACQFYTNCFRYTDIASANNLTDPNAIDVGQILSIPK